jgi:Ca2+-binding EF-hand superfamily protein
MMFMKKLVPALLIAFAAPAFAQSPQDPATGFLGQFDTNKDGKVSLDEFKAPQLEGITQQFRYMDKNGDGSIDTDEIKAFTEEMHERMKQMQQQQGGGR